MHDADARSLDGRTAAVWVDLQVTLLELHVVVEGVDVVVGDGLVGILARRE